MSDIVITVDNLSKSYLVGHQSAHRDGGSSLREALARQAAALARKTLDMARGRSIVDGDEIDEFWALKDVSFEVRRGEVVGIIGRNGAGKSTLLKILSRITEPTRGRVRIKGSLASLLEIGTGFHPELTGRENIFLNGAILGMKRNEIRAKFDEIVAFSEIEAFLDTPVKRYSSGMYVRLAFAVAAHLDPEILIVDEVLSVGDALFQKKCVEKMDGAAREGRTVILVSHDMRRATSLCSRGILLEQGTIRRVGEMATIAGEYLAQRSTTDGFVSLERRKDRSGTGEIQFQSVELLMRGERRATFAFGESFSQRIVVDVKRRVELALCAATIVSSDGVPVYCFMNNDERSDWVADVGQHELTITVEHLQLYPGTYFVDLWLGDRNSYRLDLISEAIAFTVTQHPNDHFGRTLDRANGLVYQRADWKQVKKVAEASCLSQE